MRTSARGFSLVELMIAMALGVMLTLVIGTVFSSNSKSSRVVEASEDIQAEARLAVDVLRRDLRMAGWYGCNSNMLANSGGFQSMIPPGGGSAQYLNDLGTFITGYRGTGSDFAPSAPTAIRSPPANADARSDALTLRIPRGEPVALTAALTSATQPLTVAATDAFVDGDRAIVSDCAMTVAFRVTGLTPTQITHANGPRNTTDDLGRKFGLDATVTPFTTVSYFLADEQADVPVKTKSLYRREGTGTPEEIAGRVEAFRATYGVDTNGDGFADQFLEADAVGDWSQVVAVRISLLMATRDPNITAQPQPYTFDGVPAVVPGDRKLRRPYNVTVQLRNRTA